MRAAFRTQPGRDCKLRGTDGELTVCLTGRVVFMLGGGPLWLAPAVAPFVPF
jgi:hypothetical protein